MLCNFKTVGGIALVVNVALVLRSCTTLEQFFEAFERVVLPALVKGKELFGGSLCFVVQAETASALKELWNLYKDGTLKNRLQEFLVTKEVQDLAGSDKVEVTLFIDEHEWREAYINMLFHQNQGKICSVPQRSIFTHMTTVSHSVVKRILFSKEIK